MSEKLLHSFPHFFLIAIAQWLELILAVFVTAPFSAALPFSLPLFVLVSEYHCHAPPA